jgi:alkylhydroperoxidase family enzyme
MTPCRDVTARHPTDNEVINVAPRIEPIDENVAPEETRAHFKVAEERGAPNSKLLRILARDPKSMSAFYDAWNTVFYDGVRIDHGLKEVVRVRMARLRDCGY